MRSMTTLNISYQVIHDYAEEIARDIAEFRQQIYFIFYYTYTYPIGTE